MTYYQIFQLEHYGNILPETEPKEIEDEDTRLVDHYEIEILNYEYE